MVKIDVYSAAGHFPYPPSGLTALLAWGAGQAVANMTDGTGSVVEGGESWGHSAAPGEQVCTGS